MSKTSISVSLYRNLRDVYPTFVREGTRIDLADEYVMLYELEYSNAGTREYGKASATAYVLPGDFEVHKSWLSFTDIDGDHWMLPSRYVRAINSHKTYWYNVDYLWDGPYTISEGYNLTTEHVYEHAGVSSRTDVEPGQDS